MAKAQSKVEVKAQRSTSAGNGGKENGPKSKNGVKSGNGTKQSNAAKRGNGAAEASKVRFAVVGLGHIAQAAVLPAFVHASENSELVALVTGDQKKLTTIGKAYGVDALYDYNNFRRCLHDERIDAVYIATPNTEHRHLAIQAAELGVHVLCEKPLSMTERDCTDMIHACKRNKVRLMTAYRLHFDAANLKVLEVIKSGKIGEPKVFTSIFSYQIKDRDNIRLQQELGGGPLSDIGIYCINAARSIFHAEPTHVHAWSTRSNDSRFREVDETVHAMLRFPGERIANFTCSFGIAANSWYQVVGTKGDLCLDNAYEYTNSRTLEITAQEKTSEERFPQVDQFAAELRYFSGCVLKHREPEPSGLEGLADVRVIRALGQSLQRGKPLVLPSVVRVRHPSPKQRINLPAVRRKPRLVHAQSASK